MMASNVVATWDSHIGRVLREEYSSFDIDFVGDSHIRRFREYCNSQYAREIIIHAQRAFNVAFRHL